jgi:hypothetical protein
VSIGVTLDELPAQIAERPWAYLLTVGDDGRPHLVATVPVWRGESLIVEAGRRTRDNAARQPLVALVYPPVDPAGYSLIVDVTATIEGESIMLTPTNAVLHRPAIS